MFIRSQSLRSFDLDYPVECDDEYWEASDPKVAFTQPPGKPSEMTYFIWTLELAEILGFTLRTLYATKKSKMLVGLMGSEWESQVVAELDSSMNKFKDSIPQHRKVFACAGRYQRWISFQCAGIWKIRIILSLLSLLHSILPFIISRSRYTGPFWWNSRRWHLRRWQFATMLHARLLTYLKLACPGEQLSSPLSMWASNILIIPIEINGIIRCLLSPQFWSCFLPTGHITKRTRLSIRKRQWSSCGSLPIYSRMVKGSGILPGGCGECHESISVTSSVTLVV